MSQTTQEKKGQMRIIEELPRERAGAQKSVFAADTS
jgi:hypothetical protein